MKLLTGVCLFLFASHIYAASILPITADPIPSWADASRDVCEAVRSCDDCRTGAEYCKYLGKAAHCCAPPAASITPIEENPIPEWASPNDVCKVTQSCDDCAAGSEYCQYNLNAGGITISCCSNPERQVATEEVEDKEYTASILPIVQDPIPAWASASDVCMKARSCDDCQEDQYCRYTKKGNTKCCGKSAGGPTDLEDEVAAATPVTPSASEDKEFTASILPITENPIPEWASDSDICYATRSCDTCDTPVEYCKYVPTENPNAPKVKCCAKSTQGGKKTVAFASASNENKDNFKPMVNGEWVASILPIAENPIPEWASRSDVCMKARSCDDCQQDQYCRYSKHGNPKCCGKADATTAPASILPITENPIPDWAAPTDTCTKKKSCDYCSATQYCKYTSTGRAQCCDAGTAATSKNTPTEQEPASASILPITTNPIPSWASDNDMCLPHKSCDQCHETAYCKYTKTGQAQCCSRPAGVAPPTESPIPSWASKSDICLEIRSCDSCQPSDSQYCHYNKKGKAKCCTRF